MKKTVIIGIIIVTILIIVNSVKEGMVRIPDEAIRIRVLASSNSTYDQAIKMEVKDLVSNELYKDLVNVQNIHEARRLINRNIPKMKTTIGSFFKEKNYQKDYSVIYGLNYFPKKEYKDVYYDEGYYESLLVTIGDGQGDNWWCVLFPPLCLLEAQDEEKEDVEYKFFVQELIEKYF